MTSLIFASETPSLAASLATKASRSAVALLLQIGVDLLQRGAQLRLGDAELLGQRGRAEPGRRGRTAAAAAGAAGARAGAQVGERGAQLGLADADLLREVGELGLVGAAVRAGPQRIEGGADLGLVDAELGREGVVEALEPVAATLAADDLAVAVELLERGRDLGLVEAELGGQRLGERRLVTRPWPPCGRDAGPRAPRAAWPRSRRAGRRCRRGRGGRRAAREDRRPGGRRRGWRSCRLPARSRRPSGSRARRPRRRARARR